MKLVITSLAVALLLALGAAPGSANKKKQAPAPQVVESPWTAEQLKAYLKPGLKVVYTHKEPMMSPKGLPVINEPHVLIQGADDKKVEVECVEFMPRYAGDAVVCEAIKLAGSAEWETVRCAAFNYAIPFGEPLEVGDEKLTIDGKRYDCKVYTKSTNDGARKDKWWVCLDMPGLVLKYQDLGVAKINGATIKDHVVESYVATKLTIPKESVSPSKAAKLAKKKAR